MATANKKIEAHEAEKKLLARKGLLLEVGLEGEEAEATIEKFAEASDELFGEIVALMKKKGALPPWLKKDEDKDDKDDKDDKKKKDDAFVRPKSKSEVEATEADEATEEEADEAEGEAQAEILEEVEEEAEAVLADAGDDSTEELQTSASEWLESNVLRSTANLNK